MSEPLSRFTPSVMPAATLEDIFVAREPVLRSVMRRVEEAAHSDTRNQTLIVGPRGSGKTHLIALTYHRTKALIEKGLRLQVAWLPEDPWTIASYRHLLSAITERVEGGPRLDARGTVPELEARLIERARSRGTIVVLVENFDRILYQLGETGQQQLRHFLQHECRLLLVATSTTLDRNLADQARPFFGFFTTTRLRPFTPEQGRDMLTAIATRTGDTELAEFLQSELGLSRIKTIAHLAGGQPRLWALLASSLRVSDLTSLVDLLLTRFDDLTPYYQEQLAALSPQQRLIVAELAETDHPLHVGALAEQLGIDQRSVASSIGDLAERGWVASVKTPFADLLDRRRTYYELAEPMVRLSFQIKESRGEPVRLIIDFLKSWFDPTDLRDLNLDEPFRTYIETVRQEFDSDDVGFAVRRLTALPITRAPALALLGRLDDALAAADVGDASGIMELPTSLRLVLEDQLREPIDRHEASIRLRITIHDAALTEVGDVPTSVTPEWITRAEHLVTSQVGDARLLGVLIRWLSHAGRFDEANAALEALTQQIGPDDANVLAASQALAHAYEMAGNLGRAIPLYEAVLEGRLRVLGPDHPDTLMSRDDLAVSYVSAGDAYRAISMFEGVLEGRLRVLGPDHPDTLSTQNNIAVAWNRLGAVSTAIQLHEKVLESRLRVLGPNHPDTLSSQNNLAAAYEATGEADRAISMFEAVLAALMRVDGPDHPDTLSTQNNLASAHERAGNLTKAITVYEHALAAAARVLGPDHPDTLLLRSNLAYAYGKRGDLARATSMFEAVLSDRLRVLGPDHPHTLMSQSNLANAYLRTGDPARAIPLLVQTLTDRVRVLGPNHPETRASRSNLAMAYELAGDLERAISMFEAVLKDRQSLYGPDDPEMLRSRIRLAYAYLRTDDPARAISLLEQTLADTERVLGPDHPVTKNVAADLAAAQKKSLPNDG